MLIVSKYIEHMVPGLLVSILEHECNDEKSAKKRKKKVGGKKTKVKRFLRGGF